MGSNFFRKIKFFINLFFFLNYMSFSNNSLSGMISKIAASKGGRRKRRRKSRKGFRKSRKNRTTRYRGGSCGTSCMAQNGGLSSVTNINRGYAVGPPNQFSWDQSALANPSPYTEH